MKTTFIYCLKDPRTAEVRYVGKSNNPRMRLRRHLLNSKTEKYHAANWIKSLRSQGLQPVLEILDEILTSEWPSLEAAYIEFFRDLGCALTNSTDGGEAGPCRFGKHHHYFGKQLSFSHRKKLSLAHKNHPGPNKGKVFSLEHRNNLRLAHLGKPSGMRGKKHSLESVEKNRIAHLGKRFPLGYQKNATGNT